jgi:hypothetical protein
MQKANIGKQKLESCKKCVCVTSESCSGHARVMPGSSKGHESVPKSCWVMPKLFPESFPCKKNRKYLY